MYLCNISKKVHVISFWRNWRFFLTYSQISYSQSYERSHNFYFLGLWWSCSRKPIYVVIIEVLGGDRVFSKTLPSFHSLLEDSAVTKVTFDCRCDSNALFHQFGVFLAGGSTTLMPPKNNIYFTQAGLSLPPFFQAWKKCCHTTLQKLPLESRMLHIREIQMFGRIDHSQWLLSTMLVTMWM